MNSVQYSGLIVGVILLSHDQFTIEILDESICPANGVIKKPIRQGASVTGQNMVIGTIVPPCSIQ